VELTPLRYFRAIAQAGHMTKAARALGVSQPALSAMLKKLEAEVGAALLDRTGRGVELTEAGRIFLTHAEDAIRRADAGVQAVRQLAGLEAGSIRIGGGATAVTYLLPPVVSEVRRAHPGLRFYVRETGSAGVASAVLSGELDLGIVTLPVPPGIAGELITTSLVEDELRLIVPKTGPIKSGTPRPPSRARRTPREELGNAQRSGKTPPASGALGHHTSLHTSSSAVSASPLASYAYQSAFFRWKDLSGVPVVAFEAGTAVRQLVDEAANLAGITLDVVMELRSIESIKSMVAADIGVGFVSRFALKPEDGFGDGLASKESRLNRTLAIVRRSDRTPSAAVREFERACRITWSRPRGSPRVDP
jgi:DNA-binding transcriptional LysR family regulator